MLIWKAKGKNVLQLSNMKICKWKRTQRASAGRPGKLFFEHDGASVNGDKIFKEFKLFFLWNNWRLYHHSADIPGRLQNIQCCFWWCRWIVFRITLDTKVPNLSIRKNDQRHIRHWFASGQLRTFKLKNTDGYPEVDEFQVRYSNHNNDRLTSTFAG